MVHCASTKMTEIIVTVEEGALRGKTTVNYNNGQFYSFYGIPYATPPLGELRFMAPQPPTQWEGIRDATLEREGCISRHTFTNEIGGGEDCLFLSIYSSMLPAKEKPVMIWIHGGAFNRGSNKIDLFGPDYLLTEDIVLVTVSYRLGALGFLCLEDTSLGVTGNNSFRDMIMALKWVQKNIRAFLGNPNNVTLFGESSGAVSAHFLMLSPLAQGLFHKLILQSGCALHLWVEGERDSAVKMAEVLGLSTNNDKEILEFLQKQPVDVIFKAQDKLKTSISPHIKRHFYPVIEKVSPIEPPVISEDPMKIIKSGKYNRVPMIIGHTSNEGLFFEFKISTKLKNNPDTILISSFEDLIPHHLNIPRDSSLSRFIANEIKQFYFNDEDPTRKHLKQFYEVYSDVFFNYFLQKTAKIHMENLGHAIYYFRFSVDGKFNFYKKFQGGNYPGASHSDDVCYLFKTSFVKEVIEDSLEEVTIQRMVTFWTNFARYGDPNVREYNKNIALQWKPIEEDIFRYVNIGPTLSLGLNPEHDRMQFWDKIYSKHSFFFCKSQL